MSKLTIRGTGSTLEVWVGGDSLPSCFLYCCNDGYWRLGKIQTTLDAKILRGLAKELDKMNAKI